ncbi:hypothetical protein NDU88_000269 [Pleurodeles waltl]|uniref:Uncharacterized protein n=1 Tax=Pleurodeles waltl TaxID=8319 RepID=A0AAV7S433_PLEWA|nr:hypothetical protein NDU88_000269 [Pleurodeles waltl]
MARAEPAELMCRARNENSIQALRQGATRWRCPVTGRWPFVASPQAEPARSPAFLVFTAFVKRIVEDGSVKLQQYGREMPRKINI